ncbi:hypothetical protein M0811_05839 [Anaeramoeba ignava]|uniref:Uncharacterized protein n=1 Tax=Anaeramoeba ignava TaxID=1746090 RepID=A0A9Q0LS80_ANAIG|nr:hypothetical protein M0811_05839 [Anaeramoeba ignava]
MKIYMFSSFREGKSPDDQQVFFCFQVFSKEHRLNGKGNSEKKLADHPLNFSTKRYSEINCLILHQSTCLPEFVSSSGESVHQLIYEEEKSLKIIRNNYLFRRRQVMICHDAVYVILNQAQENGSQKSALIYHPPEPEHIQVSNNSDLPQSQLPPRPRIQWFCIMNQRKGVLHVRVKRFSRLFRNIIACSLKNFTSLETYQLGKPYQKARRGYTFQFIENGTSSSIIPEILNIIYKTILTL